MDVTRIEKKRLSNLFESFFVQDEIKHVRVHPSRFHNGRVVIVKQNPPQIIWYGNIHNKFIMVHTLTGEPCLKSGVGVNSRANKEKKSRSAKHSATTSAHTN
jgi:hypothetical protein